MQNLPRERLSIAVAATAGAERVLEDRRSPTSRSAPPSASRWRSCRRSVTPSPSSSTKVAVTRAFVDRCIVELDEGKLGPSDASMAKYWASETAKEVVDGCLQLHGGYGYMKEYPVAKAYLDTRVQTIYGGTSEIMKEIIGRVVLG